MPGAFSSGNPKGADFAAVIEEIIKVAEPGAVVHVRVPDRGWNKSGCYYAEDGSWSIAWRVHDAQFWGVPQRRKRISLVADFGGLAAPEVSFERKGLRRDFEQSSAEGQGVAGTALQCTGETEPILLESNQNHATIQMDGTSTALPASMGMGGGYVPMVTAIPIHDKATRFKGGGATRNGDGSANGLGVGKDGDPAPTILCGDKHMVCAGFSAGQGEKARGIGWQEECSPSLKAEASGTNMTPTVFLTYQNVTGPLMANSHPGSYCGQDAYNDMLIAHSLKAKGNCDHREDSETYPVQNNVVRRLTPLECERLQGYPDGWTDIGEWVDSKGKKHKDADSPRYKALGNSIALPFWQWLLKRISAQYERDATLGSLFDGIGGFPYCWERVNGKGSARWASEIEEFPMAVTKLRFGEE